MSLNINGKDKMKLELLFKSSKGVKVPERKFSEKKPIENFRKMHPLKFYLEGHYYVVYEDAWFRK